MSARLSAYGRLLNKARSVNFTFNGKKFRGYEGDTLASALLANGQILVGRSFKYHRPRGIVAAGVEEPNALVNLGVEGNFEPNQRATTTELFEGLLATSQNHWPSLEFDLGALNSKLSRFMPAGFYYKMFIHPRPLWKYVYEPFIRHAAGLGKAPKNRDADTYEHFYAFCDVLVIGGGIAGLHSAKAAAKSGARVIVLEQSAHWGGRALVDGGEVDGSPVDNVVDKLLTELSSLENVTLRNRATGAGIYDHGYALGYERLTDHTSDNAGPRHRLWRIRASHVVTATGAIERPLSFSGNDVPGVMLASAVRDYVVNYGVGVGDRTVIVTNNDDAYRTAIILKKSGLVVQAILDARMLAVDSPLVAEAKSVGIRVLMGHAISKVLGGKRVTAIEVCSQAGRGTVLEKIECDTVAMSGGWSPVVHLWSHCGGKLIWDENFSMFRPDVDKAPKGVDGTAFVSPAGSANGHFGLMELIGDAHAMGQGAAEAAGFVCKRASAPEGSYIEEAPMVPVWLMPQGANFALRSKSWLDYQNDVKVTDVQLAAQEGFESVEHAKRYTTLGMATDQGKLSNINGLAILSDALNQPIPQTGTTTFRPPYTPISLGAIAGEARGEVFQPVRRTPMHDWHDANGASWEPVGQWRRPYAYVQPSESIQDAVMREVKNTRENVGLLDASTLGKILVKGPDAGKFLDMLYTNVMSTLKSGKCRYGLMCNENGFLIDDGVVARINEETFLCHTTTGGAESIYGHMEEWLQTEWWDWNVYVANVTEQFAQIALVGPNARQVLERLSGMDVSKDALKFMEWTDGLLGGFDVRIFRISFSGELSFEIVIRSSEGQTFWNALIKAGKDLGIMPYGTEALHILRAEKGFIMIGDETDGTVIPQDLGLHWALSKKKEDYIGKRAHARSHMSNPDRWQLVGLETLDGSVLPDGAYAVAEGVNANGQNNVQGRVTSSYHSPNLNKGIAMGLVIDGPNRMGQIIDFPGTDGKTYQAKIVNSVFYDPEGEKQNV